MHLIQFPYPVARENLHRPDSFLRSAPDASCNIDDCGWGSGSSCSDVPSPSHNDWDADENGDPDTFFAPTDKAILSFLDNNPAWSTIEDIPAESLNEIIRNHLLSNENIVMDGIKEDLMLTLSNGNTIVVKIEYPKWLIMQENRTIASINVKDIQGVNGVVHQVDRVLIP